MSKYTLRRLYRRWLPLVLAIAALANSMSQPVILSEGAWLFTWLIFILLLVVALLIHDVPVAKLWTTPILRFALLWLVLPMIREGAWQVSTGDSGNRILTHMLAVVVAFLVLASIRSWSWIEGTHSEPHGVQA